MTESTIYFLQEIKLLQKKIHKQYAQMEKKNLLEILLKVQQLDFVQKVVDEQLLVLKYIDKLQKQKR